MYVIYNFVNGGERFMEEILEMILTEIKGVKEEVKEVREEVKDIRADLEKTKIELREEMQVMKKELRQEMKEMKEEIYREMDYRFDKQSKEIAEELRNLTVYFEERNREIIKINNEILKELRRNRIEHEAYDTRFYKIELAQANLEERLQKVG